MLGLYVHNLNPVIVRFTDAIQLRWYGLAYLGAFIAGVWLLEILSRRKRWVLPPGAAGDFIAAAAIFGVFIGGRVGYMLFYYGTDETRFDWITHDPLAIFRVWEGGMASHGGILGLMAFTFVYARRKNVSWTGLGDGLCVVAPVGLFLGRAANFINGELYGRVAPGVSWAMKFPKALIEKRDAEGLNFDDAMRATANASEALHAPYMAFQDGNINGQQYFETMLSVQRHDPAVSQALDPFLQPRHPSQIYEGLMEGALLFSILWWVRNRWPNARHGILTGLFFICYAIFRIIGEQFREPDSEMFGPLTKGQFLSVFMILIGAGFIVYARLRGPNPPMATPVPPAPEKKA